MAIARVGDIGATNSTAANAAVIATLSGGAVVGSYVFVLIGKDNTSTSSNTDGGEVALVDDGGVGNVFTKVYENTYTAGSAGDGATASLWMAPITIALIAGDVIRVIFASTATAKAVTVTNFSVGSGNVLALAGARSAAAVSGSSNPGALSPNSLIDGANILFLRATAYEHGTASHAPTAGYTEITEAHANTGTISTSMSVVGEFAISTAAGTAASQPSLSSSCDSASVLAEFIEVSAAATIVPRATLASNSSNSAHSSLAMSTSTLLTAPAGAYCLTAIAKDNTQTTDGQTSEVTGVSDTAGNTWSKLGEYTNGQGSAAAGATVSVWGSLLTSALAPGASITASYSASVTASAGRVTYFTAPSGGLSVVGSLQTAADDATATLSSLSISGLASAETLFVRAVSIERGTSDPTITYTTGYNNIAPVSGGASSSMIAAMEMLVATGTGTTSQPTLSASKDSASVLLALRSTAAALSATPGAQSTLTAALTTAIKPAASLSAVATATAALTASIRLAATPAAVATLTASLTTSGGWQAAPAGVPAMTAALTTSIRMAAAAQTQATASAALTTAIRLAAAASASSAATAGLSTSIRLVSAQGAVASMTAALSGGIQLAANATARPAMNASLYHYDTAKMLALFG